MKPSSARFKASGLVKHYKDALGNWREAPAETCAAILDAAQPEQSDEEAVLIVRRGRRKRLRAPAEIRLEDGGTLKASSDPTGPWLYQNFRKS
jgi:hypothetical protein